VRRVARASSSRSRDPRAQLAIDRRRAQRRRVTRVDAAAERARERKDVPQNAATTRPDLVVEIVASRVEFARVAW